jgi:hypothetical protein
VHADQLGEQRRDVTLHVPPGHPDAGRPLLPYVAAAIAAMGGDVLLTDGDETLVRARRPDDPCAAAWLVVAPGLPGLLHEFVHANQVGYLADDHDLDYKQIPYDLARGHHRKILWDELAACVLSCAWVSAEEEEAWFAEQVGILGVFYGFDHDPPAFFPVVDAVTARHAVDLHAVIAGAFAAAARIRSALGSISRERRARDGYSIRPCDAVKPRRHWPGPRLARVCTVVFGHL